MAAADYNFKLSRNEIITAAFRKLGAVAPNEDLEGDLLIVGNEALNVLVKAWQTKGVFLWSRYWLAQTLSDGTASYAFPTDTPILALENAFIRTTTTGDDEPLELISWPRYCEILDKDEESEPTSIAVDWRESKYYFYPVPDKTYYFKALAIHKLKDFDTGTAEGDIPAQWQRALIYGLAADLAPEFNPKAYNLVKSLYSEAFAEAKGSDRERVTEEVVRGACKL